MSATATAAKKAAGRFVVFVGIALVLLVAGTAWVTDGFQTIPDWARFSPWVRAHFETGNPADPLEQIVLPAGVEAE